MWSNPQFPADLVTFTGEILNVKLHFLCSVTKVTLNSFIFAMDIFCTGPVRKFEMIGITTRHEANFCLLNTADQWMKSNRQLPNVIN